MNRPVRRAARALRIWDYLAVTYPPVPMFGGTLVIVAGDYFMLEAIAVHARLSYTWRVLGAAVSCFLLALLLRVYDELKDAETDRRLGATGDPKYVSRPIVTGLIDVEDLNALRWGITAAAVAVNLLLGPAQLVAFTVVYGAASLSYRWFFWPKMREHLLVAFVTHNPLSSLISVYIIVAFSQDFGLMGLSAWPLLATIGARQGIVSAWEIARKIRAPEEETDYVTYSRVLGWRVAPLLPMVAILVSTGCFVWNARLAELSVVYTVGAWIAAAVPIAALVRFRVSPNAKTSKLQPVVEAFAGVVSLGTVVALVIRWGMNPMPIR